jgi:ferredoxin-NADP reductase/MOSC domain-containing protein YiiM
MARLLSVNVGMPRDIAWQGKLVRTAVWKTAVKGSRTVRRLNVDGDGQGDLAGHGGEHRAVFVYQIQSYRYWQGELGRHDFVYGQFGENFTVDGPADTDVCIGDRYRIGTALFEVTQPRVTCYRVGIRMNNPEMAALLVKHGRPGFYFRVLEEGSVEAGDEIIQVASGPRHMSVSQINALLYLPGHPREELERALRIPALSVGWQHSLEALLKQTADAISAGGNAGLSVQSGPPPAWQGFRPLRIAGKIFETDDVVSLLLEPTNDDPLPTALPGQFIILRLGAAPAATLTRSYSLSAKPGADCYRVSIKLVPDGAAGAYVGTQLQLGDIVQAGAARGSFTLGPGDEPIVLASAGIGVTPVLAMLQALAADRSKRQIWWLYGTRNGREHPFADEVRSALKQLDHGHRFICYSAPDGGDRLDDDFDLSGHLDMAVFKGLDLPDNAQFYICGPPSFMSDLTSGLLAAGVGREHVHTEAFGAVPSRTPGVAGSTVRMPHLPMDAAASGPIVSFARSGLDVHWNPSFHSLLELSEACDVPVRWACRTGVCHSCETALVAGSVQYAPEPLDAPIAGDILICCSQPTGDIVIDL